MSGIWFLSTLRAVERSQEPFDRPEQAFIDKSGTGRSKGLMGLSTILNRQSETNATGRSKGPMGLSTVPKRTNDFY